MPDQNLALQFYQTTLDYRSKVVSIIFASGVAVAIPNIVTFLDNRTKGENERVRLQQELEIKQKEITIKELELKLAAGAKHQEYIGKFIDQAMDKDIDVRIRFAEYFSAVADQPDRWARFLDNLTRKRDALEKAQQTLAAERLKPEPDNEKIATLTTEYSKLVQQTAPTQQAIAADPAGAPRPVAASRLIEVLGVPATRIGSTQCEEPDGPTLRALLQSEPIGNMTVRLIQPALESAKRIFAEIENADAGLRASIANAGSVCVRYIRGTTRLSSHAFGVAIDLAIDGRMFGIGSLASGPAYDKLRTIAEYFQRAGWAWGGRSTLPDPGHFEVGAELFEQWVRLGLLNPVSRSTEAARTTP